MKYYLLFACCCLTLISFAQKTVDVDKSDGVAANSFYSVGGEPFVNTKFVRLTSGSPFFKDEWMKGTAVSAAGIRYKSGILKLDLLVNEVHFLDAAEKEMIVNSPLKELTLTDTISGKVYHFINASYAAPSPSAKKGWWLQAVSGKAALYQYFSKQLQENKPYGSATTEQTITTSEEFYILSNSALVQVKKPKDVAAILANKKAELEDFIKKNESKKISNAERLAQLVTYYNSLPQ